MVLVGKPEGKDQLVDQDITGKIILKLISEKQGGVVYTGLIWFRTGTSGALVNIIMSVHKLSKNSRVVEHVGFSRRTQLHGVSYLVIQGD
jgi:hypothetical protein